MLNYKSGSWKHTAFEKNNCQHVGTIAFGLPMPNIARYPLKNLQPVEELHWSIEKEWSLLLCQTLQLELEGYRAGSYNRYTFKLNLLFTFYVTRSTITGTT